MSGHWSPFNTGPCYILDLVWDSDYWNCWKNFILLLFQQNFCGIGPKQRITSCEKLKVIFISSVIVPFCKKILSLKLQSKVLKNNKDFAAISNPFGNLTLRVFSETDDTVVNVCMWLKFS